MTRRLSIALTVLVGCLYLTAAITARLLDQLALRAYDTLNRGGQP